MPAAADGDEKGDEKALIALSIGDPTKYGNLEAPAVFVQALQRAAGDFATHGYQHSAGMQAAREAVAQRESRLCGRSVSWESDVLLASGCSGALEIAIKALAGEGDNVLVPCPGFPLYETIARSNGVAVKPYPLLPDARWEADLAALRALVDSRTRAIVVNNPSNPCGSVYSEEHLRGILGVAEAAGVPVLADEIYGHLVFAGSAFRPLAALTRSVPVISVGGIAKEFMTPGLRLGWLVLHDAPSAEAGHPALEKVRAGAFKLTQVILGACSIVQAALPAVLAPTEGSAEAEALAGFRRETTAQLEANARFFAESLAQVRGLRVVSPQGAMYVMVGIDETMGLDDVQFSQRLLDEERVFVLPGACFGMPLFFRVVFCAPKKVLQEACERIKRFCQAHMPAP